MALAVDIINRRGTSNEMRCQVQQVKAVLAIYIAAKDILPRVKQDGVQKVYTSSKCYMVEI